MSAADETMVVRFAVPTLVGAERYVPGDHALPVGLGQALLASGDAQLPDGVQPEPSDALLAAAEAAEAAPAEAQAKATAAQAATAKKAGKK